jgi:hypothetical protein
MDLAIEHAAQLHYSVHSLALIWFTQSMFMNSLFYVIVYEREFSRKFALEPVYTLEKLHGGAHRARQIRSEIDQSLCITCMSSGCRCVLFL